MTPMIDIVFLLIIFFLTVSQLNQKVLPPLQLPAAESEGRHNATATIVLNLDDTGRLEVGDLTVDQKEVRVFLRREKNRWRDGDRMPHVTIRCDALCSTTHVNDLFNHLAEQGFEFVTISVIQP